MRRTRPQQGLIAMLLAVTLVLTLGTSLILAQLNDRREASDRQTRRSSG